MKNYVLLALNKENKPVSLNRIILSIEKMMSEALGEEIKLSEQEKQEVLDILEEKVSQCEVLKSGKKYISISKTSFRFGTFYGHRDGSGRVSVYTSHRNKEGNVVVSNEKYDISKSNANGAIDGDLVLIDIGGCNGNKVIRIKERDLEFIAGEVYSVDDQYFVLPIDQKKQSIKIVLYEKATEGERVFVSLDKQISSNFYMGSIIKKYNHKNDPIEDVFWEAHRLGVDYCFSRDSMKQLARMSMVVHDEDCIGREDFRDHDTCTIDGSSTQDMDDAISFYINEKGNGVLFVDIVDIPTLIPYGTALDRDGFKKGNSYYPGGVVLPEYPFEISKGIGSLNQGVDRLALSHVIEITPSGEVVNFKFVPSVIRSKLKMSTEKVNALLNEGIVDPEYEKYENVLRIMAEFALVLRQKRMEKGAFKFHRPDPIGIYDLDGNMMGTNYRSQDIAQIMLEEFMLLTNIERTKLFSQLGIPCVYRVHDMPKVDKLREYLHMLEVVNRPLTLATAEELVSDRNAFQKLIDHAENSDNLSNLLVSKLIQTLPKARYSSVNTGHCGLAEACYSQGSSPARRYGDKINQEIAWDCYFQSDPDGQKRKIWEERIPEIAERISYTEKVAEKLAQRVFRMQCAEYMSQFVGEEFEATVVGLSDECLLVQLDNMIEGTVRVRDLKGDYVCCDQSYSLLSLDGEDDYYLGDQLLLKLKSSSKETRKIDFIVLEKIKETDIQNVEEKNQAVKIKSLNERAKRAKKK